MNKKVPKIMSTLWVEITGHPAKSSPEMPAATIHGKIKRHSQVREYTSGSLGPVGTEWFVPLITGNPADT